MGDKVNLEEALASFDEAFSPRIVATFNDNKIAVAIAGRSLFFIGRSSESV